jgi:1-deoxyxylulose-5-phosphate synthase
MMPLNRAQIPNPGVSKSLTRSVPRAQIALAWLLHKPVITAPIVGATKLEHLDDALGSLEVKLSAEEIAALEEPYAPHPVAGFA